MSYESAPGTALLATNCAACSRPLLDAQSVACGIGPECRKKYGVPDAISEEDRALANALIHKIAVDQAGRHVVICLGQLADLGCGAMVSRIAKRLGAIRIGCEGETYSIKAPYSEDFNAAVRGVPGARWVPKPRAVRTAPVTSRAALYAALSKAYPKGTPIVAVDGPAEDSDAPIKKIGMVA